MWSISCVQAEEKRASGEDDERRKAAERLVSDLRDAAAAKSLEAKEFQRERCGSMITQA